MLPETTVDRLLAAGTLLAALALVAVTAANWDAVRGADRAAGVALVSDSAQERADAAEAQPAPAAERPSRAAPAPRRAAPAAPAGPAAEHRGLSIAAVGGESWLEVRAGDADGEQLFYGVLGEGEERTFEGLPVWVRIGALGNLELRLDGAPVQSLPPSQGGVAEFVVSSDGLEPAPQG
jgi:hypothetical protein